MDPNPITQQRSITSICGFFQWNESISCAHRPPKRVSTSWVHHFSFLFRPPIRAHETLLEKKAREIVQTSPQTYLSGNLYWCRSSAIWILGRARRRSPRRVQSLSGLLVDRPDLTWSLDGRRDVSPSISFQVSKDEDQELPASETSTSGLAIGVTGYRDEPTGERS